MTAVVENNLDGNTEEQLHCFVCDVAVTGRYYTLATCRTQSTKMRLIEKLGHMVGDRYMVVISEDDIICRGCANLMNTLDRLESEMGSVRTVVLRFLEKKYALEEGELINNKSTGPGQPPQITPSTAPSHSKLKNQYGGSESFMANKRKAALAELDNDQDNINHNSKKDGKSNTWMQCDKCKYTTHYNAFMLHHVRNHGKKKLEICEQCGGELKGGICIKDCASKKLACSVDITGSSGGIKEETSNVFSLQQSNKASEQDMQKQNEIGISETVEMIAAEINQQFPVTTSDGSEVTDITKETESMSVENATFGSLPSMPDVIDPATSHSDDRLEHSPKSESSIPEQIVMASPGSIQDQNSSLCVMGVGQESSAESAMLTVQKMDSDGNAVYVQVVEMAKGGQMEDNSNMAKQVLTVAEDGTVQMVEVMWDEMVAQGSHSETDMQF